MSKIKQLLLAAQEGDLNKVTSLIDSGVDVNSRGDLKNKKGYLVAGGTALHHAAQHLHFQVVEYLISQGANVNAETTSDNWQPLHGLAHHAADESPYNMMRVSASAQKICRLLISNNAELFSKAGPFQRTALQCAISQENRGIVGDLLDAMYTQDVNLPTSDEVLSGGWRSYYLAQNRSRNPLCAAIENNDYYAIKYYFDNIPNYNIDDPQRSTVDYFLGEQTYIGGGSREYALYSSYEAPLVIFAVQKNSPRLVKMCLEQGATLNVGYSVCFAESNFKNAKEKNDIKAMQRAETIINLLSTAVAKNSDTTTEEASTVVKQVNATAKADEGSPSVSQAEKAQSSNETDNQSNAAHKPVPPNNPSATQNEFILAAGEGNLGKLKQLNENNIFDINATHTYTPANGFNSEGFATPIQIRESALQAAARHNHTSCVEYLLDINANINMQTTSGRTALLLSLFNNSTETSLLLIRRGADIGLLDEEGNHALHHAALHQEVNVLKVLLTCAESKKQARALVNIGTKRKQTALHKAAQKGNFDVCHLLISHGANINIKDGEDASPLLHALVHSMQDSALACVKLLVQSGTQIKQLHFGLLTCLDIANQGNNPSTVDFLKKACQLPTTNLVELVKKGNTKAVDLCLTDLGYSVNTKNGAPLYEAAGRGDLEMVKLLLSHGANVQDSHLFAAGFKKSTDIFKLLREAKSTTPQNIVNSEVSAPAATISKAYN